ncbi:MAG: hypothetical protein ACP5JF_03815 [Candidatus Methanodesulfokora sp.]
MRYLLNAMRVSEILGLLLTFFSPVFFPASIVPMPWRIVLLISPTTSAAVLMRRAIGLEDGVPGIPIYGYILILLAYLVFFL